MSAKVSPEEALRQAIGSILEGPGDPRSVEGVKVNALQSIAWSLIGILARQTGPNADDAVTDLIKRAGVMAEIRP